MFYVVSFDSEQYFVQAGSVYEALDLWQRHVKIEWGDDYDGSEDPESVIRVFDSDDVITEVGMTAKEQAPA